MIYLVKDKSYFDKRKEESKLVFFISFQERNNLSFQDFDKIFKEKIYENYFFEKTPFLDFFSQVHLSPKENVFLLIENLSLVPLKIRIKSEIIMEKKREKKLKEGDLEMEDIRQNILNILQTERERESFKNIAYYLGMIFFSQDQKTALNLILMIEDKYNIDIN